MQNVVINIYLKLKIIRKSQTDKLVPRICNLSYSERLSILGLPSLSERGIRGDMIQMFKFRSGLNSIDWVRPPSHCSSLSQSGPAQGIKGHKRRLSGQAPTNCAQRENFFTIRVIREWYSLPDK